MLFSSKKALGLWNYLGLYTVSTQPSTGSYPVYSQPVLATFESVFWNLYTLYTQLIITNITKLNIINILITRWAYVDLDGIMFSNKRELL